MNINRLEVEKLLKNGIICEMTQRKKYSNVFTRNKIDGKKRMILNLKNSKTYLKIESNTHVKNHKNHKKSAKRKYPSGKLPPRKKFPNPKFFPLSFCDFLSCC